MSWLLGQMPRSKNVNSDSQRQRIVDTLLHGSRTSEKANHNQSALAKLLTEGVVPVRRKTFFSFHFDDVMRVNNVRNAFKIYSPTSLLVPSFYDSSLWESRKLEGEEALKRLIREGVSQTSVVCVLIGTETWSRPWVRYEIARSVIDGKGLLAVDINGLNHHERQKPDFLGDNPLCFMGVGKEQGRYLLFEKNISWTTSGPQWRWSAYQKHTLAVELPKYLSPPDEGCVVPLDSGTSRYDFVLRKGSRNIGSWIDLAAKQVGR